ncbi:DnaA ATPase domain-containing protein [Weissella sagaensis]|uniref:DnaA ATPase domain-containing protein n=1 Tax=Weissella sagaensis TaxID=2559928 RepID=UPI0013ED2063|nr:DnaA/Hda family protein [Weissella sagaensis]
MGNLSEAMEKLHEFALSKGTLKAMPTQEEIAEKKRLEHDAIIKSWQAQERAKYFKASLWGDEAERSFTFQDWQPVMQGENEQTARNVANQAYKVMKELDGQLFNVMLYGKAGTGKTSLALAIISGLSEERSKMFVSLVEWRDMTYQSFHDEKLQQKLAVIEKYMREVDVLVLDDFGKETQKEAKEKVAGMLFRLADARKGKATIMTSNDNAVALANKYDNATLSRLIPKNPQHVIAMNKLRDVREV